MNNESRVLDPRHQVPATFDADSGIVEVFPLDPERSGYMLGIRPDVGGGAFVRVTAEECARVAALLTGKASSGGVVSEGDPNAS